MNRNLLNIILFALLLTFAFNEVIANDVQGDSSAFLPAEVEYEVTIYPNPVFTNSFKVKGTNISTVEVINVIGQVIVKKQYDITDDEAMEIPLNNCEKGMYLVKITFTDKKSIIKKLLVK